MKQDRGVDDIIVLNYILPNDHPGKKIKL